MESEILQAIKSLESRLTTKIDTLDAKFESKIDALDAKITKLDTKVDIHQESNNQRFRGINEKLAHMSEILEQHSEILEFVKVEMVTHDELDQKLGVLNHDLQETKRKMPWVS